MTAFIGVGDVGVWTSNRERDAFLDWFAEHRCSPGDPRWERCTSDAHRWPGCGIELSDLLPAGHHLALTGDEYLRAAENYWPAVAQLLGIIDSITQGEWQLLGDSNAAQQWRRPQRFPPIELSCRTQRVLQLANAIAEERAFDRLPILADALEEAGCTDEAILAHCREPGPHVRGCWVVDLLLRKE